jgi:hypothetical protein
MISITRLLPIAAAVALAAPAAADARHHAPINQTPVNQTGRHHAPINETGHRSPGFGTRHHAPINETGRRSQRHRRHR